MSETYCFQREDTGEVIEVDFVTMMESKDGFLEVEPGVFAKRIGRESKRTRTKAVAGRTTIVSDALGFGQHQLSEMESDRQLHGFSDIEFKPDPHTPQFFQVHCGSEAAKKRYMRHRGFTDRNSRNGGGQVLSPDMIEQAKAIVDRKFST
jgi:hypothetical protein